MRFSCSAWIRASSSTTRPRATLMRCAVGFISGERLGIDQVVGLGRQRAGERDDVGAAQQLGQPVVAKTASAPSAPWLAIAPGARPRACRRPWRAWPAARRCGRGRRSAGSCRRARPRARRCRRSCRASAWPPGCRGPMCSWRLRARISAMACSATALRIDAGGVGEADAVRAQHVLVVLVDAGADRLDELELLGAADQLVLPHHRHDQHVGIRQRAAASCVGAAHLDMARCRCRARRSGRPCGRRRGQSRC